MPKGRGHQRKLILGIPPTFVHLHPLTQTDQILRGNAWDNGRGACFRGSATPLLVTRMRRAVCQRSLNEFLVSVATAL